MTAHEGADWNVDAPIPFTVTEAGWALPAYDAG